MQNKLRIFSVVFFILVFILVSKLSNKNRSHRDTLNKEGWLTIGVIRAKSYSGSKSVSYTYRVGENELKGGDTNYYMDSHKSSYVFLDNEKSKPGSKFLVIYDKENPKESIIRLDYPIKDSTDFKRYVKEFEEMRKRNCENTE